MVDAADPLREERIAQVDAVLEDIGAGDLGVQVQLQPGDTHSLLAAMASMQRPHTPLAAISSPMIRKTARCPSVNRAAI